MNTVYDREDYLGADEYIDVVKKSGLNRPIGDRGRVEAGQRHHHGSRIALDRDLVRLAHIDQHHAAVREPAGDLLGGQIVNTGITGLIRHGALLAQNHASTSAPTLPRTWARDQMVTCVPTSTTRSVGIWK